MTLTLINNSDADWSGHEFYYDDNGVAHRHHLKYGDDYTLESGNLVDDIDALAHGFIFNNEEYDD
jgi:hypothetical protein